jgi:hypothetical protein
MATVAVLAAGCGKEAKTPDRLNFISGGKEAGYPGSVLPTVPVVEVLDEFGRPVPGVLVKFSVDGGGAIAVPEIRTGRTVERAVGSGPSAPSPA